MLAMWDGQIHGCEKTQGDCIRKMLNTNHNARHWEECSERRMMLMEKILKLIGDGLSLMLMLTVFVVIVSSVSIGAILLIAKIGNWIGIGWDIFILVVYIIAFCKAWDIIAWVIDKIAERGERRKERGYFEPKNDK